MIDEDWRNTILMYENGLPLDQRKRYQNRRRDLARRWGCGYFELELMHQPHEIAAVIGDITHNKARTWYDMSPTERQTERERLRKYGDPRKKRPERYKANSKLKGTSQAVKAICKTCRQPFRAWLTKDKKLQSKYCSIVCEIAASE